jgi:hypothetical protein
MIDNLAGRDRPVSSGSGPAGNIRAGEDNVAAPPGAERQFVEVQCAAGVIDGEVTTAGVLDEYFAERLGRRPGRAGAPTARRRLLSKTPRVRLRGLYRDSAHTPRSGEGCGEWTTNF